MRISVTYEKHIPTTVSDHSITIKQTFFGTEEEIRKVEEQCKTSIGTMLVFDTGKVVPDNLQGWRYEE